MTHNPTVPLLPGTIPPPPLPCHLLAPNQSNGTHPFMDPMHTTTPSEEGNIKQYLIDECREKINRLQHLNSTLVESKDTLSDREWQNKIVAIQLLSVEIDESLKKLTEKKRKRRRRQGKNRKKTQGQIVSPKTRRSELHSKIEAWRRTRHDQLLQEKKLEENKRVLQKFLKDNLKRTQEATKFLTKLHSASMENPRNREVHAKICQLIAVWKEALLEYQVEKVRLEGMLGISSKNELNSEEMWLDCLFGENAGDSCWTSEISLEEFVKVRTEWDLYLSSEDASPIPFFWVLPPLSSNSLWEEYHN